jgi:hypothetical protein
LLIQGIQKPACFEQIVLEFNTGTVDGKSVLVTNEIVAIYLERACFMHMPSGMNRVADYAT